MKNKNRPSSTVAAPAGVAIIAAALAAVPAYAIPVTSNLSAAASTTSEFNASLFNAGTFNSYTPLPAHRFLESVTVSLGTPIVDDGGLGFAIYSSPNLFGALTLVTTLSGNSSPDTAGLYTYTPTTPTSLTGNTFYFLLASVAPGSASRYRWNQTTSYMGQDMAVDNWNINDDLLFRNSSLNPAGFISPQVPLFGVSMSDVSTVPEASTYAAGLGLAALAGATWWRARRRA